MYNFLQLARNKREMENMAQTWQQRLEQQKLENEKMLEDEKAKQVIY